MGAGGREGGGGGCPPPAWSCARSRKRPVGGWEGAGPMGAASRVVRARHFTGGGRAPAVWPSGPRAGGGGGPGRMGAASRVVGARHFTGGCRARVFGPSGHRAVGGRRRCPSKGRRGQERDGYG